MTPLIYSVICTQIALGQAVSLSAQHQISDHADLAHGEGKHARTVEIPVYNRLDKQVCYLIDGVSGPEADFS
jgi:hypothetical protein